MSEGIFFTLFEIITHYLSTTHYKADRTRYFPPEIPNSL